MLSLTAPRVNALSAYMHRQVELDEKVFRRSNTTLAKALQGGRYLTRKNLQSKLLRAKIPAEGQRLGYLLMRAELEGILCSGPRTGKQFTYALLEERVPSCKPIDRNEALAVLSARYFRSRGPATVQDFSWWSGLNMHDARAGIESLPAEFEHEFSVGKHYVFPIRLPSGKSSPRPTFLMPEYDEYWISYQDRSALFKPIYKPTDRKKDGPSRQYSLVIDGVISGTSRKDVKRRTAIIETDFKNSLTALQQQMVNRAARRYDAFLNPTM